jgi:putative membrane protein
MQKKGTRKPATDIDSNQKKTSDSSGYSTAPNQTGQSNAAVSPDFKFADNTADAGMAEIKLGELAQKNAADKTVQEFGKSMVRDHTKAADELKALAQKKNITLPDKVGSSNQSTYDDLSKKTGADFDKAYMDKMVSDHKSVISDFESESSGGKDPELKSWAAKTLPVLRHHLKMAQHIYDHLSASKPTAGK